MEESLLLIAEYTGRTTKLPLICKSWRDILYENDSDIISDVLGRYSNSDSDSNVESISEVILLALSTHDRETIRLLTTVHCKYIPCTWDNLSREVTDAKMAWYFTFYVERASEIERLHKIHSNVDKYCRDHVMRLSMQYTTIDIQNILSCGIIVNVWSWCNDVQKSVLKSLLGQMRDFIYMPYPKINVPWLYSIGVLDDPIISTIMLDDVSAYESALVITSITPPERAKLVEVFEAVNIYVAYFDDYFECPLHGKFFDMYIKSEGTNPDISWIAINSGLYTSYRLYKCSKTESVKNILYKIFLRDKCITMIDLILTKDNHVQVIIDAIQEHGMYSDLYDLLIFRGIQAEWFSYYLPVTIDYRRYIPMSLQNTKTGGMTYPKHIDDWKRLSDRMLGIRYRLDMMSGIRAPDNVWPSLIGSAIVYDISGTFLTALIREHASGITCQMVRNMKSLYERNPRKGGWSNFRQSLVALGVPHNIVYSY